MHTYKKFTQLLFAFLFAILIYHLVVWNFFTEEIMTAKYSQGGDLCRMGYITGSKYYRRSSVDLPRRHMEIEDYKGGAVDMLVIGDSFSNGGGSGKNSYYQDYIASLNNMKVLNIEPYLDINFLTLTASYLHNGFLDKVHPRYLLLSSSEKFCVERFAAAADFKADMSMDKLDTYKKFGYRAGIKDPAGKQGSYLSFINEGNFKFLLYSIYYLFSDHAFYSKTYKAKLSVPLFSVKESKTLLFYRDDIKNIGTADQKSVEKINDNLNRLADMLAAKGITLYFMPCVDKYNLYREFIVDKRYPPSHFFELLRPLPKRYVLIDTKEILLPEVRRGVKDIFYADDTHWSWKASEKIFETVRFR